MCGIVSYLGNKNALPILLEGLQRLEYRGYDSAGIFIQNEKEENIIRVADKVKELKKQCEKEKLNSNYPFGMGHTRWATHGKPLEKNAHPHQSNNGQLVMIHNGIIENYEVLKTELLTRGYTFSSDTDSEVLVNLFEEIQKTNNLSLEQAVQVGLNRVVGAYGIVVFDKKTPDSVVVAKLGSPLAIGLGEDEFYIGSDATPFLEYTKKVIYLNDFEMAHLKVGSEIELTNSKHNKLVKFEVEELDLNLENIQKGGYDHFMLKEIFEQPQAIANALRGRINKESLEVQLESIQQHKSKFLNAKRIIILGCSPTSAENSPANSAGMLSSLEGSLGQSKAGTFAGNAHMESEGLSRMATPVKKKPEKPGDSLPSTSHLQMQSSGALSPSQPSPQENSLDQLLADPDLPDSSSSPRFSDGGAAETSGSPTREEGISGCLLEERSTEQPLQPRKETPHHRQQLARLPPTHEGHQAPTRAQAQAAQALSQDRTSTELEPLPAMQPSLEPTSTSPTPTTDLRHRIRKTKKNQPPPSSLSPPPQSDSLASEDAPIPGDAVTNQGVDSSADTRATAHRGALRQCSAPPSRRELIIPSLSSLYS